MDVLKQFGELDEDIQEKIKYAKFKTLDIMKAIKEGRAPTAGPPDGVRTLCICTLSLSIVNI